MPGSRATRARWKERVLETFRRCLALVEPLLAEPEYPSALQPMWGSWELVINDRLEAPNTDETDAALRSDFEAALKQLFGRGGYTAEREPDLGRRYGISIRAGQAPTLEDLKSKLS